jgi:hypothetical protein
MCTIGKRKRTGKVAIYMDVRQQTISLPSANDKRWQITTLVFAGNINSMESSVLVDGGQKEKILIYYREDFPN